MCIFHVDIVYSVEGWAKFRIEKSKLNFEKMSVEIVKVILNMIDTDRPQ